MQACLDNPRMIAGTGRICTRLMEAAPGKFLAKTGSEGSYALALPELGLGAALNIEDGHWRAVGPAVTKLLHDLGVLGHDVLDGELKDLTWPKLTNHRGEGGGRAGGGFLPLIPHLNPFHILTPSGLDGTSAGWAID